MFPKGQSLLESLLAIAVIMTGIVSLISLLISTRNTSDSILAEQQARYLAQEAIEAARSVRDSNWLKQENGEVVEYFNGLRSGTDYTGSYVWDSTATSPDAAITFDFTADAVNDSSTLIYQISTSPKIYLQAATTQADWTVTKFKRYLTLYPICVASSDYTVEISVTADGQDCTSVTSDSASIEVGFEVVVHMQWASAGEAQDRIFSEKLYNWKYAAPEIGQNL
jgi:type II secretory pathway pseudopilin PulG